MKLRPINTIYKETTTRVLYKDVPGLAQFFHQNIFWTKHDWSVDGLTGAEALVGFMNEYGSFSTLFAGDTEVQTAQIHYEYKDLGVAIVDRHIRSVQFCEYGGWSRCFLRSFERLAELAEKFGLVFDEKADPQVIAEVGTRLIMAENFASHGLSTKEILTR